MTWHAHDLLFGQASLRAQSGNLVGRALEEMQLVVSGRWRKFAEMPSMIRALLRK